MKTNKYYVTMTDSFMSGWGYAKNKINKLVFLCDSYEQAERVFNNAESRNEMKYINICIKYPYHLNNNKYYTQIKTIENSKNWYKKNYFNN